MVYSYIGPLGNSAIKSIFLVFLTLQSDVSKKAYLHYAIHCTKFGFINRISNDLHKLNKSKETKFLFEFKTLF